MLFEIKIHEETESNIELTVALPMYNSKKISWVALESLCNQIEVNFEWELIVYEETHNESSCPTVLVEYKDRLIQAGCKRILFLTGNEKVLLVRKWIDMAEKASETSKVFLLQAADCYSPKTRLRVSYDTIVNEDYDWYDQTKGYFYSLLSDRVILYDYQGFTNLNMSLKTSYLKTLPFSQITSGIDRYIYTHVSEIKGEPVKKYSDNNFYDDSLDIHGQNNISVNRESFFDTKTDIWSKTDLELEDLNLPLEIIEKLKTLCEELKTSRGEYTHELLQMFGKPKLVNKVVTDHKNVQIAPNNSLFSKNGVQTPLNKSTQNKGGLTSGGRITM